MPIPEKKLSKKLALFLASIAPGIFLLGYNIGTGAITTVASAGAKYGMMMVWPLLFSCFFAYIQIIAFGHYTIVTGDTAIYSYRKYFGSPLALIILISLVLSEIGSCIGIMGVLTQVMQEWSRPLTAFREGFNPVLVAAFWGALLYLFYWNGKHKFFEKVMGVFVFFMVSSFILSMFFLVPDPIEIIKGLVPRLPTDPKGALFMAGIAGATMGVVVFITRCILVQEQGWTLEDSKVERRDAIISASLMFLVGASIMVCAAGTLHPMGLEVKNAIDMVKLLVPLAGRFATSVFVAGIYGAGLSSLFPIMLLAPWLIADYQHKPREMQTTRTRLLVLGAIITGLIVPLTRESPILIMIISQVTGIFVTPLAIILMIILYNRKTVMGEHTASFLFNLCLGILFLFSVIMTIIGIVGIVGLI